MALVIAAAALFSAGGVDGALEDMDREEKQAATTAAATKAVLAACAFGTYLALLAIVIKVSQTTQRSNTLDERTTSACRSP